MIPWLSVVIPTVGRDSLELTLASIRAQPESAGVEVLVVADTYGGMTPALEDAHQRVLDSGFGWLEHDGGRHCVGQPQRNAGMRAAQAAWTWYLQDDNIAAPDSLANIEEAIAEQPRARPLFFRFESYWREIIWRQPVLAMGNIDADCLVFPRYISEVVEWGMRYEGDFDAALMAFNRAGGDVGWIDAVVSISRPATPDHYWWMAA